MGMVNGSIFAVLTAVVLVSAIVLHSYAALQLRKSIIHPEIPLGNQTPIGIRFIGYIALFFAFVNMINSITIMQHMQEFVQQLKLQMPAGSPNMDLTKLIRGVSVFALLFSITIVMNVVINFRLLKWYMMETKE